MKVLLAVLACLALAACGSTPSTPPANERAQVIGSTPHDTGAFTEGLELDGTTLYEGTGLEGQSDVRVVDLATGEVKKKVGLPDPMFGEGITVVGDKLWQLTYKDGVAIQRDKNTLAEIKRVNYDGEGWGLCHDGSRLVMSNGTDQLTFRDPDTFAQVGTVTVRAKGDPVAMINELECTPAGIYANIWQTDTIIRIDAESGNVTASVDLANLLTPEERGGADVLNGIAAIPGTDEFLVTGKNWPKVFRVKFVTTQ